VRALVDEGCSERAADHSPQSPHTLAERSMVLNLCAPTTSASPITRVISRRPPRGSIGTATGLASGAVICGTQTVHQGARGAAVAFLGTDDTILYSSCFDANGGLFETLLDEHTHAVISTRSTTLRSSMASACAAPSDCATTTTT